MQQWVILTMIIIINDGKFKPCVNNFYSSEEIRGSEIRIRVFRVKVLIIFALGSLEIIEELKYIGRLINETLFINRYDKLHFSVFWSYVRRRDVIYEVM